VARMPFNTSPTVPVAMFRSRSDAPSLVVRDLDGQLRGFVIAEPRYSDA
jgi:hypothetical protein